MLQGLSCFVIRNNQTDIQQGGDWHWKWLNLSKTLAVEKQMKTAYHWDKLKACHSDWQAESSEEEIIIAW